MSSLNEVTIRIRADATQLQTGLTQAQGLIQGFGASAGTAAGGIDTLTKGVYKADTQTRGFFGMLKGNMGHLAAMGLGFAAFYRGLVLVNAGLDSIIGGLAKFDENMRNVQSLTKQSDASLDRMSESVLHLVSSGDSAGKSAVDLSAALYELVSSGFSGSNALALLKVAAQGAAAGLTTTQTSATILAAILNAYKRPVSDARDVMDSLFRIVDLGVVHFEDLANTLGLVLPTAAALHINLDELGAGIVELTRQGQKPSRVMTNLNAVMTAFLKPSKQAQDTAKQLGIDFSAAAIQAKGFPAVIADIAAKAGDNDAALVKMFGNVRAIRAIFPLAAAGGQEYLRMLAMMAQAHSGAGATARALAEQQKSLMFQLRVLGTRFQAYVIEALRPVITWLAQKLPAAINFAGSAFRMLTAPIAGLARLFRDLNSATGGLSTRLLLFSSALWLVVKVAGGLRAAVASVVTAMFMSTAAIEAEGAAAATTAAEEALLTGATMAQAAAAADAAAATTSAGLAMSRMMGWVGVAITALLALGAAYSFVKNKFFGGAKEKAETTGQRLAEGYDRAAASLGEVTQAAEDTTSSLGGTGGAVQAEIISPLEKVPHVADESRYALERLSKQFASIGVAAAAMDQAEKALTVLHDSLSAVDAAIRAANLSTIREALEAIGGSPTAYEAASAAVNELADSEAALSQQVDDARRDFGVLDDTMQAQKKTLKEYQDAADKINKTLSRVKDRIDELNQTPIAGEAAYKQARYEIDRQLEELQYALESLPDTPANKAQRATIQRQISDLTHERSRVEIEFSRTIGEARHQMEMIEGTLTKEVAAPTLVSAVRDVVQQQIDLTPAAQAANEKLDAQETLVADLTPAWQAAQDRLTALSDGLGIVDSALSDFQSALESTAQFAVERLNAIQAAAEGAGGAIEAMPEEITQPMEHIPISAAIPGIFTLPEAEEYKKRLERGLPQVTDKLADDMVQGVVVAYQEAAKLLPEAAPQDLMDMTMEDLVRAGEDAFGARWPEVADQFVALGKQGLQAAVSSPQFGASMENSAAISAATYADAVREEMDKEFPGTTDGLLNAFIEKMNASTLSKADKLAALGKLAVTLSFPRDAVGQALVALNIPAALANELADQYARDKDSLAPNLRVIGEGLVALSLGGEQGLDALIAEREKHGFLEGSDKFLLYLQNNPDAFRAFSAVGEAAGVALATGMSEEASKRFIAWAEQWQEMLTSAPTIQQLLSWTPTGPIPGKQHGVRDFLGGLAMVGEGGRELLALPRGSSIASARDTSRILDFLKASAAQGGKGAIFAPRFDIHAIGDQWDQMKMRILSMVSEYLDKAAAEAGMNSPLVLHGVGIPRV